MTDAAHEDGRFRLTVKELSFFLTIVILVIGFATAWGTLNERVDNLCTEINEQAVRIEKLELLLRDYNEDATDTAIRLARIETDLAYIRAWLEKQDKLGGG